MTSIQGSGPTFEGSSDGSGYFSNSGIWASSTSSLQFLTGIDSDWLVTSSRSKVRLRYRVKKQIKRTATKIIMMSPVNRLVSPTIIIISKTKSIANKSIDKIKLHKKATVSGVVGLGIFCGAFDYLGIDGVSNLVQYINQNILLAMMLSAMSGYLIHYIGSLIAPAKTRSVCPSCTKEAQVEKMNGKV
jgi:hypothetical protein